MVKLIVLKKKENTENIVSKNESKIEFIDTSYDTDEIKVAELIKNGFTIQTHKLELYGLCNACQSS